MSALLCMLRSWKACALQCMVQWRGVCWKAVWLNDQGRTQNGTCSCQHQQDAGAKIWPRSIPAPMPGLTFHALPSCQRSSRSDVCCPAVLAAELGASKKERCMTCTVHAYCLEQSLHCTLDVHSTV
eukprot:1160391-Pelagomonas_calceolata.AAC.7